MTFSRLAGALLAAGCFMFVLASVGAQQARSSTGCNGSPGFNFELGLDNTCDRPTTLSGSSSIELSIISSAVGGRLFPAVALYGHATAATGSGTGVLGVTDSSGADPAGVAGTLATSTPGIRSAGVVGLSRSETANGVGVWGFHIQNSGTAPGVLGQTNSTDPTSAGVLGAGAWGVEGIGSGGGVGVFGHTPASATASYGVAGLSGSTAANAAGVLGTIGSTSPGSGSAAVRGINNGTGVFGVGVWGSHAGSGWGVYGSSPAGKGVVGQSTTGLAGYFAGDVQVNGTLTKGAGAFRIDHPLDPAHSYLQHSFVESPDMKNIYDGVVTTNGKGFATVTLPGYFQALNKDFRYQLTILGHASWDAQARVWDEIAHNRFTIRTNKPSVKVSWQVTGTRHDRYANAHRIQVVVLKQGSAEGRYLHPELYGKPLSKSVVVLPRMKPGVQPKFRTAAAPAHK